MSDKPWKRLERSVAALIGGTRFPANQGGAFDAEGPLCAAQVKLLKRMSLAEVSRLAEEAAKHPTKLGLVATKIRPGRGYASPIIVSMTAEVFAKLLQRIPHDDPLLEVHQREHMRLDKLMAPPTSCEDDDPPLGSEPRPGFIAT